MVLGVVSKAVTKMVIVMMVVDKVIYTAADYSDGCCLGDSLSGSCCSNDDYVNGDSGYEKDLLVS